MATFSRGFTLRANRNCRTAHQDGQAPITGADPRGASNGDYAAGQWLRSGEPRSVDLLELRGSWPMRAQQCAQAREVGSTVSAGKPHLSIKITWVKQARED